MPARFLGRFWLFGCSARPRLGRFHLSRLRRDFRPSGPFFPPRWGRGITRPLLRAPGAFLAPAWGLLCFLPRTRARARALGRFRPFLQCWRGLRAALTPGTCVLDGIVPGDTGRCLPWERVASPLVRGASPHVSFPPCRRTPPSPLSGQSAVSVLPGPSPGMSPRALVVRGVVTLPPPAAASGDGARARRAPSAAGHCSAVGFLPGLLCWSYPCRLLVCRLCVTD